MINAFLIKYAEIALKGKNRHLFEDALIRQMRLALEKIEGEFQVTKEQGRVYVHCHSAYDFEEAVETLQKVFEMCIRDRLYLSRYRSETRD